MTTGIGPYVVPDPVPDPLDTDPAVVLETTFIADHAMVDLVLGGGLMAHAETFNGAIPGPTLRLDVGDTAVVRLVNLLHHPTSIHWHGLELANSADGTEVTQDGVAPAFAPPPPPAPAGGTYLYKFKVPRPGLFWYHPHHHGSINRTFRGMYGMIVVSEPAVENPLIAAGVIPGPADTRQLVLGDITVCKAPGMNDAATYPDPTLLPAADRPEWLSGATSQPAPTPVVLCEIGPMGDARDEHGMAAAASYTAGDVPSLVRMGRTNEGQTVLTNGIEVGGRAGTPLAPPGPGALSLAPGETPLGVQSGQGLRLQIANCATTRYFRLILTTAAGVQVPLVRIGGEGGLLDSAVVEGGILPGGFDTEYTSGEILLPAGSRADVVAAIPAGLPVGSVLTLWTRDFQRTGGGGWANLPTVPVMHLEITGAAASTYTIGAGTALRTAPAAVAAGVMPVEMLGAPTGAYLIPAGFAAPKPGMPVTGVPDTQHIRFTTMPPNTGVNGVVGNFEGFTPYTSAPHIASSRYAEEGRTLEMLVVNTSPAHHPFHLHGFSFQPVSLTPGPGAPAGAMPFIWPYREFRDNLDLPGNYTLTLRVRLDDRPLVDGATPGGAFGRWLLHCHIFFHHHQGMISELVVTAPDGSEKPDMDVFGSWAYAPVGGTATRQGRFFHRDGDLMTLAASKGTVTPAGPAPGGSWSWSYTSAPGDPPSAEYVYVTAADPAGRRGQAVFRLKIGAPDDGADIGDPHIRTVDGKLYDFQAAGEFILLRDHEGMEVQARQWPVAAANPITDAHSGLTVCVSLNTAVAARVGSHRIAYQPGREPGRLEFYLDGKPAQLTAEGIDLDGHRVSGFDVGGAAGLRVDYAHHAVLTATPHFWSSHGLWYLNVRVSHTQADEGLMGSIPEGTWLPRLPNGATVGPMPQDLHERYATLYRTFANAWRVTDRTSLFIYAPGTSTQTFTDEDWPGEKPPCQLKEPFVIPGAPLPAGMSIEQARQVCAAVTDDDLHQNCVFDVATTGDESFAEGYRVAQDLRRHGTAVQLVANEGLQPGEPPTFTATVLPTGGGGPVPAGSATFLVDDAAAGEPVPLDADGRARFTLPRLEPGTHRIRAAYTPAGGERYHPSGSPSLVHTVEGAADAGKRQTSCAPWLWAVVILVLLLSAVVVYIL